MPRTPLLEVNDLRTHVLLERGVVHAVNGVSFGIAEGEILGLIGETGCGKSLTARSLIGLTRPPVRVVGGSVRFAGVELLGKSRRALRRQRGTSISFIPQNPWGALNPVLRVQTQMANVVRAHGRSSGRAARDQSLRMLRHVGLADPERIMRSYAHELSGGMAQRVVIAIALMLDPRLVVADEPTTGLDVTIQRQILELVVALIAQEGRAMLLITHDLGVIAQYCQRVAVMYAGKIVESGPVGDVLRQPAHPYTRALIDAVPRRGHALRHLRGTIPDLVDYPQGCPFAARCAHVFEPCHGQEPALAPLAGGVDRRFACHLPGGVRTSGVASAR